MKGEAKVIAEAEPPGVRIVSERNGGDSRSGVNEHVNKVKESEMDVSPAEATARQCGAG